MFLAAAALAAASPAPAAPPVQVLSREVAVPRHDLAPIAVRCNRTSRSCRGVLVLGVGQCSTEPVANPDCQIVVGRKRFAIPPRTTRTVTVRRLPGPELYEDAPDRLHARATPHLRGARRPQSFDTRFTRRVVLVASPALRRAALPPALREAERLSIDRDVVRAQASAPLGTTAMTLELDGRRFDLHPEGFHPYRVRADSLVPGGAVWHGELPVGEDELRAGQRVVARLTACGAVGCAEVEREITLGRDRTHDLRPICDLRPLTAVR